MRGGDGPEPADEGEDKAIVGVERLVEIEEVDVGGVVGEMVDRGGEPEVEWWFFEPGVIAELGNEESISACHAEGGFFEEDFVGEGDLRVVGMYEGENTGDDEKY